MAGTFGFQKGLKVLSNKVFRFIQQTLIIRQFKNQTHHSLRVDRERLISYSVISDQLSVISEQGYREKKADG